MSDGDGLGFFGGLALGQIAGALDSQLNAQATATFFNNLRHRQEVGAQEVEINSLILRYNQLVRDYNYVFDCAKSWQVGAERRGHKLAQLGQELAAANQRASDAEAHAADFQSRYEYYLGKYEEASFRGTQKNQRIRDLEAEIEQLKNR